MQPVRGSSREPSLTSAMKVYDSPVPKPDAQPKPDRPVSDEAKLLQRYAETGDPALKEELVRRFLPLARSLALRYRGSSEDIDDLVQVASLGLVKALDGFDLERGQSFIAYAAPTILGELRRHFRDRVWDVRLPRGLQERTMAVHKAAAELSDELGPNPDGLPDRRAPRPRRRGGLGGPAGRRGSSHAVARGAQKQRGPGCGDDHRDARPDRSGLRRGRGSARGRGRPARRARAPRPRAPVRGRPEPVRDRPPDLGSPRCRSRGSCEGRSASCWPRCRPRPAVRRMLDRRGPSNLADPGLGACIFALHLT